MPDTSTFFSWFAPCLILFFKWQNIKCFTEKCLLLWWGGHHHSYFIDKDTQGLAQSQQQVQQAEPSSSVNIYCTEMCLMVNEHSYETSTGFCGKGTDPENVHYFCPDFQQEFAIVLRFSPHIFTQQHGMIGKTKYLGVILFTIKRNDWPFLHQRGCLWVYQLRSPQNSILQYNCTVQLPVVQFSCSTVQLHT